MGNHFAWLTIPASVVVLACVVTLPEHVATAPRAGEPAAPAPLTEVARPVDAALPAGEVLGPVMVREAGGELRGPYALAAGDATRLRLPAAVAGRRVALVVQRYRGAGLREDWLSATVRVRDDATLPLLGLQPGRYFVAFGGTDETPGLQLSGDVEAGGELDLR